MTSPAAAPPDSSLPPTGDSAVQAVGYGFRVLTKPDYLWAPILLAVIQSIPVAFVPGMIDTATFRQTPGELAAYVQAALPAIATSLIVGLIVGPILAAVCYRLARQFIDGQEPVPFGPGLAGLAWRIFLQEAFVVIVTLLTLLAMFGISFGLFRESAGAAVGFFLLFVVWLVVVIVLAVRFALALPLMLDGAGPIESLRVSWRLTRGHGWRVFRWLFVAGLLVGLVSALLGGLVSALFGELGGKAAGQLLGGAIVAPLSIVSAVSLLLLLRLITEPQPATPPVAPDLPSWMAPPAPAGPSSQDLPDWMTPPAPTPPASTAPPADGPPEGAA